MDRAVVVAQAVVLRPFSSTTCASAVISVPTPLPYMCWASSAAARNCRGRQVDAERIERHADRRRAAVGFGVGAAVELTAIRREDVRDVHGRIGRIGQRQLAGGRRATDVEVVRVDPAGHGLARLAVARIAHLDTPALEAVETLESRAARQLMQGGAARDRRVLYRSVACCGAKPARRRAGRRYCRQRDRQHRERRGLAVVAGWRAGRVGSTVRRGGNGSAAGQEDVGARLDLVGVGDRVGADDRLQVDAVAIGDVGQRVARVGPCTGRRRTGGMSSFWPISSRSGLSMSLAQRTRLGSERDTARRSATGPRPR